MGLFLLTAVAYTAGSALAIGLIARTGLSSVFFIPAGVTVAFLVRTPRRVWWLVLAAAALAEASMDLLAGYSLATTTGFVAANVVEPLIGALLITAACTRFDLGRLRHLNWFIIGGVLVGPAVGAGLGSLPAHVMGEGVFLTQFPQWWLGDALAVVMVGGAILAFGSAPDRRPLTVRAGMLLVTVSILLTLPVVVQSQVPLVFLVLVGVVIAGATFGSRAVAVAALTVASVLTIDLALGVRIFPFLPLDQALLVLKLQLGVFTVAGYLVAAEANELERASRWAAAAEARAALAERERRVESQIALRLQHALLPRGPIDYPHLDIAARYEAGTEAMVVGGDWYGIIPVGANRLAITIGDVVGHGLEASAAMGRLRTAAMALAPHSSGPRQLLENLDTYVLVDPGTEYATTAFAVLEVETGELTYSSAGHPPLLLVEPSGQYRWLMEGRSAPLGSSGGRRTEASIFMKPASLLVGFSDGLIERRGEDFNLSLRRLAEEVQAIREQTASEVCDSLLVRMGVAHHRQDDVVILALRYQARPYGQ